MESDRLLLRKAVPDDWPAMYRNVWSHPETFQHTWWEPSLTEEDAKDRILRTIAYQKARDSFFVIEKASGEPIGFAGVELAEDGVWEETGICIGPAFTGRGYGKEILKILTDYCRRQSPGTLFRYRTFEENTVSRRLALSAGFTQTGTEEVADPRNGRKRIVLVFSKIL